MQSSLEELKRLIRETRELNSVIFLLSWDQATQMPPGGAAARGRQLALLTKLFQEKSSNPEIGRLLDQLEPYAESLPYDSDDAGMIRAARREFERQVKVPPAFMAEQAEHQALSYQVWAAARPANDFKKVQPYLEKTLDYSRRLANFYPGYNHIADPLIAYSDYGLKAEDIRRVFAELRAKLVPLIQQITAKAPVEDEFLYRHYPREAQIAFGVDVVCDFGYDFNRGRIDLTHHPFATTFSINDVRITTRVKENYLGECMFSTFHESGHAMYEQFHNPAYEGTALNNFVSAGLHESQSRTWENLVGRSRGFWQHYFPKLHARFPQQLKHVDAEMFYRAVNQVRPSLIRTDADEVTYNLHPMIRFDLELALLDGSLAVKDLPEAWNARYESDLGIRPPDDSDGVLQDVHWYGGYIGGSFQGYTLGNILSAMFYEKALAAHPEIPGEICEGKFNTLHGWLRENIYQHGAKYTASELIERITGGGLDVNPLMAYLTRKYGEIYEL